MAPNSSKVRSIIQVTDGSQETSTSSAKAFLPAFLISSWTLEALDPRTSAATTHVFRILKPSAIARPMPWPAPVTIATVIGKTLLGRIGSKQLIHLANGAEIVLALNSFLQYQ